MDEEVQRIFRQFNLQFIEVYAEFPLWLLCREFEREKVHDEKGRMDLQAAFDTTWRLLDKFRPHVDPSIERPPPTTRPTKALRIGKALATEQHFYSELKRVGHLLSPEEIADHREAILKASEAMCEVYFYFLPEFEKSLTAIR